jgi:hypothetical protein
MPTWLWVAFVAGLIPAFIAKNKGRSVFKWWLFGAVLFPVALVMAILAKPDETRISEAMIPHIGRRKTAAQHDAAREQMNVPSTTPPAWRPTRTDGVESTG